MPSDVDELLRIAREQAATHTPDVSRPHTRELSRPHTRENGSMASSTTVPADITGVGEPAFEALDGREEEGRRKSKALTWRRTDSDPEILRGQRGGGPGGGGSGGEAGGVDERGRDDGWDFRGHAARSSLNAYTGSSGPSVSMSMGAASFDSISRLTSIEDEEPLYIYPGTEDITRHGADGKVRAVGTMLMQDTHLVAGHRDGKGRIGSRSRSPTSPPHHTREGRVMEAAMSEWEEHEVAGKGDFTDGGRPQPRVQAPLRQWALTPHDDDDDRARRPRISPRAGTAPSTSGMDWATFSSALDSKELKSAIAALPQSAAAGLGQGRTSGKEVGGDEGEGQSRAAAHCSQPSRPLRPKSSIIASKPSSAYRRTAGIGALAKASVAALSSGAPIQGGGGARRFRDGVGEEGRSFDEVVDVQVVGSIELQLSMSDDKCEMKSDGAGGTTGRRPHTTSAGLSSTVEHYGASSPRPHTSLQRGDRVAGAGTRDAEVRAAALAAAMAADVALGARVNAEGFEDIASKRAPNIPRVGGSADDVPTTTAVGGGGGGDTVGGGGVLGGEGHDVDTVPRHARGTSPRLGPRLGPGKRDPGRGKGRDLGDLAVAGAPARNGQAREKVTGALLSY